MIRYLLVNQYSFAQCRLIWLINATCWIFQTNNYTIFYRISNTFTKAPKSLHEPGSHVCTLMQLYLHGIKNPVQKFSGTLDVETQQIVYLHLYYILATPAWLHITAHDKTYQATSVQATFTDQQSVWETVDCLVGLNLHCLVGPKLKFFILLKLQFFVLLTLQIFVLRNLQCDDLMYSVMN